MIVSESSPDAHATPAFTIHVFHGKTKTGHAVRSIEEDAEIQNRAKIISPSERKRNMYICEDCGVIFEEAEIKRHLERNGEELDPPSCHCPECGSEFYVELEECDVCGEQHPYYEVYDNVCEGCRAKIVEKLRKVLRREFSAAELDAIYRISENDDLFKEVLANES